jgi:hypothetical protein
MELQSNFHDKNVSSRSTFASTADYMLEKALTQTQNVIKQASTWSSSSVTSSLSENSTSMDSDHTPSIRCHRSDKQEKCNTPKSCSAMLEKSAPPIAEI